MGSGDNPWVPGSGAEALPRLSGASMGSGDNPWVPGSGSEASHRLSGASMGSGDNPWVSGSGHGCQNPLPSNSSDGLSERGSACSWRTPEPKGHLAA